MKIQYFIYCAFLLLGMSCSPKSTAQSSPKELLKKEGLPVIEKAVDCDYELYMCQGEISRKAELFLNGNEIKVATLIIEKSIHGKNPLKVDKQLLTTTINNNFPAKNTSGIGVLDWEGKALGVLEKADPNSKEFQDVLAQYIYALDIVQKLRPNIKWGFYGLPHRDYWNRNDKWRNRNFKLLPLLKKSDIIFPSVYDFYETSFSGTKQDSLYVNDNMVLSLELAEKANRPVMPFVYHRYHPSNKRVGGELIEWEEFGQHIDAALKARYKNRKVDGIVWWGADRWYHGTKNKAIVKDAAKNKGFDAFQNKVIINYSKNIYELFEENCK